MQFRALLTLARNPRAVPALLSWPKFSITSFLMVEELNKQGIRPRTVIDVGANAGQFAVACARTFKDVTVHSFEPQSVCVSQLQEHGAKLGNIMVYAVGLGEKEDTLQLHINAHNHSSSFLQLATAHREAFPTALEISTETVRVSTLDREFHEKRLPNPVLLKLDVQGFESSVLRGGKETLKRVDYVLLEASLKALYEGEMLFPEMLKLMGGFGYRFLRPVGSLSDPRTGEILQMDALFLRQT